MHRKIFRLLLVLAIINNTVSPSDIKSEPSLFVSSVLISGALVVSYGGMKLYSCYAKNKLSDPSPVFQKFAREVLNENDSKDTALLPLKIEKDWKIVGGSFMAIDPIDAQDIEYSLTNGLVFSDQKKQIIIADGKYSLLHEKSHYYSCDLEKGILFQGLKFMALNMLHRSINNPYYSIASFLLARKIVDPIIMRKHERDADRYAFMNMKREDLVITKTMWQVKTENLEGRIFDSLHKEKYLPNLKGLNEEEQRRTIKLDELNKIEIKLSSQEMASSISLLKRIIIEIVSFLIDADHPSCRSRMELADEYLQQRTS